jgi:cytosine/adenosine deaminase-related metal-dependent hydrolase
MKFRNLHECSSGTQLDISIDNGKIQSITEHHDDLQNSNGQDGIYLQDAVVFPGLINSHDHLDFNNFPQLGNRIYNNYVEWGQDIHAVNKDVIEEALKLPKHLRIQWGMYKNLLNGVTTVVNHGETVAQSNAPITIHQQCHVLHSVQLEKGWRLRLNKPFRKDNDPFVIHIGEGTDKASAAEVKELIRWNLSGRKLIGVHGVSMSQSDATHFHGLVWCPASNFFLLGRTAEIDRLKNKTTVVFGTDSTLSAPWNMWEHLRIARESGLVNDKELFDMLTHRPASLWKPGNTGSLRQGYDADIVIALRKNGLSGLEAFYALDPEDMLLVIHKGAIKLFDESLSGITKPYIKNDRFGQLTVGSKVKHVEGDLSPLSGIPGVFLHGIKL